MSQLSKSPLISTNEYIDPSSEDFNCEIEIPATFQNFELQLV